MLIGPRCFPDMADISHYRERVNHLRQLAERRWQDDLAAEADRAVCHDYWAATSSGKPALRKP